MKKGAYALFILTFAMLTSIFPASANAITPNEPEGDNYDYTGSELDGEYLDIVPIAEDGEGMCLEATPEYCEDAGDLIDELTDENSRNFITYSLVGLSAVLGFVGITLYIRNR